MYADTCKHYIALRLSRLVYYSHVSVHLTFDLPVYAATVLVPVSEVQ